MSTSYEDIMSPIFRGIEENITREQAEQVRFWRVEMEGTWRWVASQAYYKWDCPGWLVEGHQLYGMALCEVAAKLLQEDPNKEPWN